MVPQIIEFFVQFLEGHIPSIARDPKVDGVDLVAEACAQINESRVDGVMRCCGPCLMAFFLAPPLKVRLRGCGGRAAQCARSRTRTRRAMGLVSRRRREWSCPPAELRQFVRLKQSKL